MTTADKIIAYCERLPNWKQIGNGSYRGSSPLRTGSDGNNFTLDVEPDGEHGTWYDHKEGRGGSLYDLARELGIVIDSNAKPQAMDTHVKIQNLAEYAQKHGVSADVFERAGWVDGVHNGHPALIYPTKTGKRVRYLDMQTAGDKYKPFEPKGYKLCWYGLNGSKSSAIGMAQEHGFPAIVLCNGEASTIVAHHYGIPACATTGGESKIPANLLEELNNLWNGDIIIAMDCDDAGRKASHAIAEQLGERAVIVDLGLPNKSDLADFLRLYGYSGRDELFKRYDSLKRYRKPTNAHDAMRYVSAVASGQVVPQGRTLRFPFQSFWHLGGFCRFLPPRYLTLLGALSGHGKTSFLESICESFMAMGANGIYDGREFEPEFYSYRRIQRHTGREYTSSNGGKFTIPHIQQDKYLEHIAYLQWRRDIDNGIAPIETGAQRLSEAELSVVEWVEDRIASMPGHLEYAPKFTYIQQTLEWAGEYIIKQRAKGVPMDYMVFDHLNVMRYRRDADALTSPENEYMQILGAIKNFAQDFHIHAFVATQVNKTADKNQRKNSEVLTVSDFRYINDQDANLTLSLNLKYTELVDEVGNKVLDYNGDAKVEKLRLTDGTFAGAIAVLKNSMGVPHGIVNVKADFEHLQWLDESW